MQELEFAGGGQFEMLLTCTRNINFIRGYTKQKGGGKKAHSFL